MATLIKTSPFRLPLLPSMTTNLLPSKSLKPFCLSICQKPSFYRGRLSPSPSLRLSTKPSPRLAKWVSFASNGEVETTEAEQEQQTVPESEFEDSSDGAPAVEDASTEWEEDSSSEEISSSEDTPSTILAALQSYKEALTSNDEPKIAEVEALLKSIEDEKTQLEREVATLTEALSTEKDRVLRISADFDNFRKRTERERLSLVENAQGELVESLLPVMDNFERAKAQIKADTEGEQKINNSYQSIYKQFMEILSSLGVVPVDTIGKPFDPMLHEAIMREDSEEFEEGIILEEYRKGFKLGDRLLRPSMVKVSAGPGPGKPEEGGSSQETDLSSETSKEGSSEAESS